MDIYCSTKKDKLISVRFFDLGINEEGFWSLEENERTINMQEKCLIELKKSYTSRNSR